MQLYYHVHHVHAQILPQTPFHPQSVHPAAPSWIHLPGQYFADAAVTHAQPARDLAGTHAPRGELHYALPHRKRQRAPIDEDTAELVHPAEPCREPPGCTKKIKIK